MTTYDAPDAYFRRVAEHFQALQALAPEIEKAARVMADAAAKGNKILFCGNGGSAADSQHLAAELMGRYLKDRNPLAAAALTVDTSALTAIGNDYGYQDVFSRQLRGLGRPGDVLVGLSTSGNSENVVRAIAAAKDIGIATIGLTGGNGGKMSALCDVAICVPAKDTNHIQEMHIAVGHWLCGFVENEVC